MLHRRAARSIPIILLLGIVAGSGGPVLAGEGRSAAVDLQALYRRLEPGMTVQQVARAAERAVTPAAPTSWLLWTPPAAGRPTEILRTAFREGRLVRIEYEAFGDEYRRLVKGERRLGLDGDEATRLWRRSAETMEAAEDCSEALEALHRLVLGLQERLTPAEQQAWVRALQLRRAADAQLRWIGR